MDFYADCVRNALTASDAPFRVQEFTPRVPGRPAPGGRPSSWSMRFARYVAYPMQARARRGDINHIVDHGYGHLLHVLNPRRTVVTVHDVIPVLAWRKVIANHGVAHRPLLAEYALAATKKAARVIAVSQNTKNDLVQHLGFSAERISVIHNGVSEEFRRLDPAARLRARAELGLPEKARVVLITGWQHYKNHHACAEAFASLVKETQDPDLRLVRLGRKTSEWHELTRRHDIADRVIEIEWLAEPRLVALYNAADVLFFPSIYEGFGWPPLQAMACGLPVVCSNTGSLKEIAGDAAITVDPADIPAMVAALKRLLGDEPARRDAIERGLRHAARFSWSRNARLVSDIYLDLATRH